MEKTITFVTNNCGKFEEVKRWVNELEPSIILEQAAVDLPEYQSLDIHTVALGKAKEAWMLLKRPLLIDDGGIYIQKYNQFPGVFSKYVFQGIGLEGIWLLAKSDPRAYFLSCLVYMNAPEVHHFFEGICTGKIIEPKTEAINKQLPYTEVFIPDGSDKTLAQMRGTEEEKKCHHRLKAIKKLLGWLEEA